MTDSIDTVPVNRFNRTSVAVCAALVALVWIVFGQTLRHGFINFDDNKYVYENAQVSSGLSYHGFVWAFTFCAKGSGPSAASALRRASRFA